MRGGDPKRDVPPVIDDPALAELAERFMAGDVGVREKRGSRRVFGGRFVDANGRRYSSSRAKGDYRGIGSNRR